MRKAAIIVLLVTGAIVAMSAMSRNAVADAGGCYSPQPICIGGTHPVCACDIGRINCYWECR